MEGTSEREPQLKDKKDSFVGMILNAKPDSLGFGTQPLVLSSCVTWDKSLHFSGPLSYNTDKNRIHKRLL